MAAYSTTDTSTTSVQLAGSGLMWEYTTAANTVGTTTVGWTTIDGNYITMTNGTYYPAPTSPEERSRAIEALRRFEADQRRRQEEWRRQQRQLELERVAARRRAAELLLSQLDDEQRTAYEARHRFRLVGADGKLYEIARGRQHNVWELDASGRPRTEFCITHPDLPDDDIVLAQKLLLETDPARFRRIANATPVAA